jgi:DNA-binding response OmpR family regulator
MIEAPDENDWVIVVDDDDASQGIACATLAAAGYETIGVSSTWGLRRLRQTDRAALVLFDVSPHSRDQEVLEAVEAIRGVAHDKWRIAIMGVQPLHELRRLGEATGALVAARSADPYVLLRSIQNLTRRSGQLRPSASRTSVRGTARILLIDDSEFTLQLIQDRLCDAGFDVRIAVALNEAQSIFGGWSPDVNRRRREYARDAWRRSLRAHQGAHST